MEAQLQGTQGLIQKVTCLGCAPRQRGFISHLSALHKQSLRKGNTSLAVHRGLACCCSGHVRFSGRAHLWREKGIAVRHKHQHLPLCNIWAV